MNDRLAQLTPPIPRTAAPIAAPVDPPAPPDRLDVVPWSDPIIDVHGFDPRDPYVERFWLGIIGPSVTWLMRRFARGLDEHPEGFRIDLADTARAIGLGESTAKNSQMWRTIDRACSFGLAQRFGDRQLAVRTHLAPLTRRQLARLPKAVQVSHGRYLEQRVAASATTAPGPGAVSP